MSAPPASDAPCEAEVAVDLQQTGDLGSSRSPAPALADRGSSTEAAASRSVLVFEPAARPHPRAVARAHQMMIVKPSRLLVDDAAPSRHEVVDAAPACTTNRQGERSSARRPVRSVRIEPRSRSPRPADRGANSGARSRLPVIAGGPIWPHGPPRLPRPFSSQKPDTRANAGSSWIPASGRSRTRTWDLFLSEKPMGETSGRDRPRKATKVLQKLADQDRRPKPPGSARTHPGGRGMDVLRRRWSGSIRAYASRRLDQGRDDLAGCRVPGGGRERSPDVARAVVPAVPCGAGTALRRA